MSAIRKAWIYKITSPTGKVYIGSTINYRNRFSKYKALSCTAQTKLYSSFCKHGFGTHSFEILFICGSDIMFEMEFYFGLLYNVLSRDKGMNIQLPKITDKFQSMSQESRDKKKAFMTGRKWTEATRAKRVGIKASPETRRKLSESHKGHKPAPESIAKGVAKRVGYKRPPEYCKWLSESQKGKKMHPNSHAGAADYREKIKKKVINTKTAHIFGSIAEASKSVGKHQPNIAKMLNGKKNNNTPLLFLSVYIKSLQILKCNGSLLRLPPVLSIRMPALVRLAVA
jgi:group I intron endonuclease